MSERHPSNPQGASGETGKWPVSEAHEETVQLDHPAGLSSTGELEFLLFSNLTISWWEANANKKQTVILGLEGAGHC